MVDIHSPRQTFLFSNSRWKGPPRNRVRPRPTLRPYHRRLPEKVDDWIGCAFEYEFLMKQLICERYRGQKVVENEAERIAAVCPRHTLRDYFKSLL